MADDLQRAAEPPLAARRIHRELTWPPSTIVLWSTRALEQLLDHLTATGVAVVRVPCGETADLLRHLGRVDLLLIDAEGFDSATAAALTDVQDRYAGLPAMLLTSPATGASALLAAMQAGLNRLVDPDHPTSSAVISHAVSAKSAAQRVLAIGAHPDDVEIGCGGTLLAHTARGDLVSVLTLSRGSVGGAAAERRREARDASIAMSAQLFVGDFVDTELGADPDLIRVIEHVVAQVDPGTLYLHSPHDSHQDHRAVHAATLSAARAVPRVFTYQSPSATNQFSPTKFVRIDETVEGKVEVLSRFRSQASRSYMDPHLVRATARYWARQLPPRVVFAEPFEVVRATEDSLT